MEEKKINAGEILDDALESVSGGWETGIITGYIDDYCETCKKTTSHSFQRISELNPWDQKKTCTVCKTWCMDHKGRIVW